jgi:hypothetical protein
MIKILESGKLDNYCYDPELNRYPSWNGITFSGCSIPGFNKALDFVRENHRKYFPHIGFIAWDIAIDANGNPLLIEANINATMIHRTQIVIQQLIFGDRTDEVADHCRRINPRLLPIVVK